MSEDIHRETMFCAHVDVWLFFPNRTSVFCFVYRASSPPIDTKTVYMTLCFMMHLYVEERGPGPPRFGNPSRLCVAHRLGNLQHR